MLARKVETGDIIYNSRPQKAHFENDDIEIEYSHMSEELLLELLFENTTKEGRLLAKKLGVTSKGSKLHIMNRINTCLG